MLKNIYSKLLESEDDFDLRELIDFKTIENEDTLMETLRNLNIAYTSARAEILKIAVLNETYKEEDENFTLNVDD